MSKIFSIMSAVACFLLPSVALAADAGSCVRAGPGAEFCAGGDFSRIDDGSTDGITYWLHQGGFMSKVLVQDVGQGSFTQGDIESSIIAMISAQAASQGRAFDFSDIEAAQMGGQPFGTLSYALSRKGGEQAILHSYVATGRLVLQIISQVGLSSASRAPQDLEQAHAAALHALTLADAGPEA